MKNIKDIFSNMFSGTTGKLIKYLLIAVGIVIVIFIVLGIMSSAKGKRLSYSEVESKMKQAAVSYYKNRPDQLPMMESDVVTVSATTLVEAKTLKELNKIAPNGSTCTGYVNVQKNGNTYLYNPHLECSDKYMTSNLVERIKSDNPITMQGDGLYQIGDSLVFRGEYVNNYISFAGRLWRILRINNDSTLRLLEDDIVYTDETWDDRYNIDKDSSTGINDFEKSRLKKGLDRIYNEQDFFSDDAKSKIVVKDLCVGKRYTDERDNSGRVECSTVSSGMPVGLMQVNEFMLASLDPNCVYSDDRQCANYNYLAIYTKSTWTLNADAANTHKAYKFTGDGYVSVNASGSSNLRLVINLTNNLNYTKGTGTKDNPYVVS